MSEVFIAVIVINCSWYAAAAFIGLSLFKSVQVDHIMINFLLLEINSCTVFLQDCFRSELNSGPGKSSNTNLVSPAQGMRDNLGLLSCLNAVYKMYWKFKSKEQKLHSDIERHELFLFILVALWSSMTRDHSCTSFNSPTTSLHVIRSKWNPNWQQMRKEVDKKIKAESNISILNPECVCVYFFDMFPPESTSWLPSKLQWASDKGETKWQVGECTAREAKREREGSFRASSIPV